MLNTENNAATLEDLDEGDSVIASYYPNNLMATEIHAESP